MADSEAHLVNCHNIPPVTVGLALTSDDAPVMHVCNIMGYMIMVQEDGSVHRQPFLVNIQATYCIMLPGAIIQQTPDCVSWRQEGHLGDSPGLLSFFNDRGRRMLHLQLRKGSGLYYYNTAGSTEATADSVNNKFTEDWVSKLDGASTDEDAVNVWATGTTIRRLQTKTMARGKMKAPYSSEGLPVIPEESLFEPILDPLAEQPLDLETWHVIPPYQRPTVVGDDVATLALDRGGHIFSPAGDVGHTEDDVDEEENPYAEHNQEP
jgi:hypothetical protein